MMGVLFRTRGLKVARMSAVMGALATQQSGCHGSRGVLLLVRRVMTHCAEWQEFLLDRNLLLNNFWYFLEESCTHG